MTEAREGRIMMVAANFLVHCGTCGMSWSIPRDTSDFELHQRIIIEWFSGHTCSGSVQESTITAPASSDIWLVLRHDNSGCVGELEEHDFYGPYVNAQIAMMEHPGHWLWHDGVGWLDTDRTSGYHQELRCYKVRDTAIERGAGLLDRSENGG